MYDKKQCGEFGKNILFPITHYKRGKGRVQMGNRFSVCLCESIGLW